MEKIKGTIKTLGNCCIRVFSYRFALGIFFSATLCPSGLSFQASQWPVSSYKLVLITCTIVPGVNSISFDNSFGEAVFSLSGEYDA